MGLDPIHLTSPAISRLMSASDRKREKVKTPEEYRAKAKEQSERQLQEYIRGFLATSGIECINPPMHKRSMLPLGWPDFTLAYKGVPCAIEAKVWGEKPRPEQTQRHEAMRANGWTVIVANDLTDVQNLLRKIDALEKQNS